MLIPEAGEEEAAVRRYWRIFYRHRRAVLGAVALCLSFALIVSLLTQRQYSSAGTIQVNRQAPKVVDIQQVDQEATGGYPNMEFYLTQYTLLKSRSLSEAVVHDLNLANNFLYLAHYKQNRLEDIRQKPPKERMDLAVEMVKGKTIVSPVRGSSIISVGFTSPNADLSAKIANSVAQNFIQSNLTRRFEAAAYARTFLQKQLTRTRAKLEVSERNAVRYAQQQGLIKVRTGTAEGSGEQSLLASQLGELSTQLTAAHAQRAQAEAQYREGSRGSAAAQSLTSVTVSTLRQQKSELVAQLAKFQSDFGPEYPPIIALRAQIVELDRQIGREETRVNSSVAQDYGGRYQQAVAAERALQRKVDQLKSQLIGEEGRSIEYNILQRDVDTNRALYDALLQRFKEVGIAGGVGANNVAIVDPAIPPEWPSSPNLLLNLALGLIFGILIGAAAALILEQLAESIILPAEFQKKLGVALLGATPAVGNVQRTAPFLPKLIEAKSGNHRPQDASALAENSSLAEAYSSIAAAVQFSTSNGAPRSMSVTSTQENEGKSTTAVSIARALGSSGLSVLLIDGDMRRPSLHRTFQRENKRGLSDVLTGHGTIADLVEQTDLPGVSVLLGGKTPPAPAELLAAPVLVQLIQDATKQFDHVVIDCPPVLGLADGPLISRAVEGVIFVVEAGRTRSSQARHALDRLWAVRANIVGAVLTKLDNRAAGYGYGYGYGYVYKYGKA
ncbi:MAG: polysaccharide biosynthesis tyrosine autokinase [Sphingomonas sp.]|nr:polysaccharide biosynthesis tyrosine autokinase [Sphingomonas sp.]